MPATWWAMLFLVDEASQEIAKTFERLQGKQLLIQQQKGHLNALIKSLSTRFFINQGEANMELQEEDSDYLVSEDEQFGVLPLSIVGKWEGYSTFCNNIVNKLGQDQQSDVATSMGEALLNL